MALRFLCATALLLALPASGAHGLFGQHLEALSQQLRATPLSQPHHPAHHHTHKVHREALRELLVVLDGGLEKQLSEAHNSEIVQRLYSCLLDEQCSLAPTEAHEHRHSHGHSHGHHSHGHSHEDCDAADGAQGGFAKFSATHTGGVSTATKVAAGGLLFVETVVGMVVPPLISRMDGAAWWLSLLNAFAGGIFLAAGVMHLIPHCQEAQEGIDMSALGLPGHYPLYLLLIVCGFLLVFAVERVAMEGHCHGHGSVSVGDHTLHGPGECGCGPSRSRSPSPAASLSPSPTTVRKSRGRITLSSGGSSADWADHPLWNDDALGALTLAATSPTAATAGRQGAGSLETFSVARGLPLLAGMSVHTALECVALGLVRRHSSFMILLAAIAAHKGVSALALAAKFTKEGATLKQVVLLVGPFCFIAPCSIAAGHVAGDLLPPSLLLLLSCLACGTFLYVGATEILPEEFEGDARAGRMDLSKLGARCTKFSAVLAAVACIAALGLMPHVH